MSGMHMLPVYYTTTNTRKRKKDKKTKSQIDAEIEHQKFLKKMGIGSRSSVGLERRLVTPEVPGSSPVESANTPMNFNPCLKKDESYKLDISSQYVIGQAYNKGGFQVLSKVEQKDPATGKRR